MYHEDLVAGSRVLALSGSRDKLTKLLASLYSKIHSAFFWGGGMFLTRPKMVYRIIWCSLGATSLALDERLSTELWHQQMRPPSPFPCDPTPLVKFLSRHKCCRLPHPRPSRFFSAGQRVATLAIMNFGTLLRPPDLRAINLSTMQELVHGKEGRDVASALETFKTMFALCLKS